MIAIQLDLRQKILNFATAHVNHVPNARMSTGHSLPIRKVVLSHLGDKKWLGNSYKYVAETKHVCGGTS